ncbi:MAG TPA: type III PLP-dependent enzyme [Alphaproteobacteria bacterium]|nr:type III PLP-dependent enzyme [Alphaproteobacteria bacterium]
MSSSAPMARPSRSRSLAMARPMPLALPTSYASAADFVADARPSRPTHLVRPHVMRASAQWFIRNFPGAVLYAVKANPTPAVIRQLWASGIRHFDVASLAEVELVAGLCPKARMHFMHPVKSREAIRKSYFHYGVRDFVIDSPAELFKLLEETRGAKDLGILIRLAVTGGHAFQSLAGKFGIAGPQAAQLLVQARKVAARFGIAFHVGQQTMDPVAYANALAEVGEVIQLAKVNPDIIDVGGGFPVSFTGLVPPSLTSYMHAITGAVEALKLPKKTKLWCEPGRALVQEAGSLIVKVDLRKENRLYINDGLYGGLFDAGISRLSYPVRLIRPEGPTPSQRMAKFSLLGPTCDSIDALKVPVSLPADVEEGDWIEIGQTGGYSAALQSSFNGFGASAHPVEVRDEPLLITPGFWQEGDSASWNGEGEAPAPRLVSF